MKLLRLLITTAFAFVSPSLASAGVDISGGGGVVLRGALSPLLLDFWLVSPNMADPQLAFEKPVCAHKKLSEYTSFDFADVRSTESFKVASSKVNQWLTNSPVVAKLILQALSSMQFKCVNHGIELSRTYEGNIDANSVRTAVLYHKQHGAILSVPVWERLGLKSQAGLLVHEALRHISIQYGLALSHISIQNLTAQIFFAQPSAGNSLDDESLLSGHLLDKLRTLKRINRELRALEPRLIASLDAPPVSPLFIAGASREALEHDLEVLHAVTSQIRNQVCCNYERYASASEFVLNDANTLQDQIVAWLFQDNDAGFIDATNALVSIWAGYTADEIEAFLQGRDSAIPMSLHSDLRAYLRSLKVLNDDLRKNGILVDFQ